MLNNKYSKWYYSLMDKAKDRNSGDEVHHILPRSLGGRCNKENLISLTYREHYIAHVLLTKFTEGQGRFKMLSAVQNFRERKKDRSDSLPSSQRYASLRAEWAALLSQSMMGPLHPRYHKKPSEEQREKMSRAHRGVKKSESHKANIGAANTGHTVSKETREVLSIKSKKKQASVSYQGGPPIQITNIRKFCKENNLSYDCMKKVLNPKVKDHGSHKGWSGSYEEQVNG